MITLQCFDGRDVKVTRRAAEESSLLMLMIEDNHDENLIIPIREQHCTSTVVDTIFKFVQNNAAFKAGEIQETTFKQRCDKFLQIPCTLMYQALLAANYLDIKAILAISPKVDGLLHAAAMNDAVDVVKILIEEKANVQARNHHGLSALEVATSDECRDIIRECLEEIRYAKSLPKGWTPLMMAAKRGNLARVLSLLADPNVEDAELGTPLHYACAQPNAEIVDALIQAKADVNAVQRNGQSAMHIAAREGHVQSIELLLAAGANIASRYPDMKTGQQPLHTAAQYGRVDVARCLLAAGAAVNETALRGEEGQTGRTALHMAAQNGHVELVSLLLDSAADPTARGPIQETALHCAVIKGSLECVESLLAHSTHITAASNQSGHTAVHLAAQFGHVQILNTLIQARADPSLLDPNNLSALHMAAENGYEECITVLIAAGVPCNGKTSWGHTALHIAAECGHTGAVRALLAGGCDSTVRTRAGETALGLASRHPNWLDMNLLITAAAAPPPVRRGAGAGVRVPGPRPPERRPDRDSLPVPGRALLPPPALPGRAKVAAASPFFAGGVKGGLQVGRAR